MHKLKGRNRQCKVIQAVRINDLKKESVRFRNISAFYDIMSNITHAKAIKNTNKKVFNRYVGYSVGELVCIMV